MHWTPPPPYFNGPEPPMIGWLDLVIVFALPVIVILVFCIL